MSLSAVKTGEGEGEGAAQGNVINLMNLQPAQLQSLRQQVEQELNFYQEAVMSLKDVQLKMQEAGNCVKSLSPDKKELLVPVTGSVRAITCICIHCVLLILCFFFQMFVRGEIEDTENVLIDIGTGYYVQKVRKVCHVSVATDKP